MKHVYLLLVIHTVRIQIFILMILQFCRLNSDISKFMVKTVLTCAFRNLVFYCAYQLSSISKQDKESFVAERMNS